MSPVRLRRRYRPMLDVASAHVLPSVEDRSVNFVSETADGLVEARFVRRTDDYFIAYLSSQTGCNKGCRFCHLTQTAQTRTVDVPLEGIVAQAAEVFDHYDTQVASGAQAAAREVHFNFMARGEVFANAEVRARGDDLCAALVDLAAERGLFGSVKFSTIFPAELDGVAFTDLFRRHQPDLYYSLYSVDPEFRRRWLPRALPHTEALAQLRAWQVASRKIPVLHWAFIEGANDSDADIDAICAAVADVGLRCDVNVVRYNPFSSRQGAEPPEARVLELAARLSAGLPEARVKVVSRVGMDVAASCGMFVAGRDAVVPLPSPRRR